MAVALTGPGKIAGAVAAPWRVMVQMRWTLLNRSLRDPTLGFWTWFGAVLGVGLGVTTVLVALWRPALLAPALGMWLLGWVLGPMLLGRTEALRPEYFAALGLAPRRLTLALLAGSMVGIAPVVSLIATSSVVVAGVSGDRGGTTDPALVLLVAALGAVTTLLLLVSVSRAASAAYGLLLRSRLGAVAGGTVSAGVFALAAQGWALIPGARSGDVHQTLTSIGRALPSGWGLVAVDAVRDGAVGTAVAALVGQVALATLAVWAWSVLLGRRVGTTTQRVRPRRPLRATTAAGAARGKELRWWTRDIASTQRWTFGVVYAVAFCGLPLAIGWTDMLPWTGALFLLMVSSLSANAYGNDGTALWLVLAAGAERVDLRARQRGLMVRAGAVAALLTVATLPWAGAQTPFVVTAVVGLIGVCAGVTAVQSVFTPTRTTDPHLRTVDPLDTGAGADAVGPVYLCLAACAALVAPAVVITWWVGWWGVLAGLATGVAAWWFLGDLAARRLERSGDQVLALLRHGRTGGGGPAEVDGLTEKFRRLPRARRYLVSICLGLGAIPLFPQGIVPMIFLINDNPTRVWFLAMYLPSPWSWTVAATMVVLGASMYVFAVLTVIRQPDEAARDD